MKIFKVKGDTYCIDTGMTYIPFYRLNEEEIILLDSGWVKERNALEKLLDQNGFQVIGVICSHAHIDHVGNNAYFKKKYKCVVAMSDFEGTIVNSIESLKVYYSHHTFTQTEQYLEHMVCDVDVRISKEQTKIHIGGAKFRIIHTPGHSPAHICIITPDDVAYLGDILVSETVLGGAKLPYEYILQEDLESKGKLLGLGCRKYIVAHKGVYDDIRGLVADNIKYHRNKAESILHAIDKDMTIEEILKMVIDEFAINVKTISKHKLIMRMLNSYLEYLLDMNMLTLKLDDGYLKYSRIQRQDKIFPTA